MRRHQCRRRFRSATWPARRQARQHDRIAGLRRSGAWRPCIQPVWRSAQADRCDDGYMRCHPRRSAGLGLPYLYVHHDAALHPRSGIETWQSRVGAGPVPMRHGLTLGELGLWFVGTLKLDLEYRIIEMQGWEPDAAPGFGWPLGERAWINPSPNAPNLWMARAYAGTVMLEGTTLSEGRGTTRPLELFGAPDIDARKIITEMEFLAPHWLRGCRLRECWFEPTFHKHAGKLCHGVQIHTEGPDYDHQAFRPWRILSLALKAIRRLYPEYPLWRDFAYEYEQGKLAIDVLNGGPLLRDWVDDARATPQDLDTLAIPDE